MLLADSPRVASALSAGVGYVAVVEPGQAGVQEWSLYSTTRGQRVPSTLVPALGAWLDIDDREDRADIGPRTPILVDPQHCIDSVLVRFFSRSRFAGLAEGTLGGVRQGLPPVLLLPVEPRPALARGRPG